jgi:hypothetical protein
MPGQRTASYKDHIRWRVSILEKPDSALASGVFVEEFPFLDMIDRMFRIEEYKN